MELVTTTSTDPDVVLSITFANSLLQGTKYNFKSDGTYKAKKGIGKPQFIAGAGIGVGYDLGKVNRMRRIFLNYDFRLQMPFVKSYVPILPNGALSLGIQFNIQ